MISSVTIATPLTDSASGVGWKYPCLSPPWPDQGNAHNEGSHVTRQWRNPMDHGHDLFWRIATETPAERRARCDAEAADICRSRSAEERALIEADWNRLTPAERNARLQSSTLEFLSGLQQYADEALKVLRGRDRTLVLGASDGVVIGRSCIAFYREMKGLAVEV